MIQAKVILTPATYELIKRAQRAAGIARFEVALGAYLDVAVHEFPPSNARRRGRMILKAADLAAYFAEAEPEHG